MENFSAFKVNDKLLQNSISELNDAFNPFRIFCKKKKKKMAI